jgi:hypothetical protein
MAIQDIYQVLAHISKEVAGQGEGTVAFYSCMWRNCSSLVAAIESGMTRVFNSPSVVVSAKFVTNDPDYRQSADGAVFMVRFDADPELEVRVECLIDHARVWLKIVRRSEQAKFQSALSSIERAYNSEFNAELNQIAL